MPAELNAGALDRRVTLLRPVYNEHEDEIASWEIVGECWASVAPKSGKEDDGAGRTISVATIPILIRYRTDIDARWRIRDREQEYEVKSKLDILRRHVQLELTCEEVL